MTQLYWILGFGAFGILVAMVAKYRIRPPPTATITTFHGLSNWRRYVMGEITLEEWRNGRHDTEIRAVEDEQPEPRRTWPFIWNIPTELTYFGRRKISMMGHWYSISIWRFHLLYFRPTDKGVTDAGNSDHSG